MPAAAERARPGRVALPVRVQGLDAGLRTTAGVGVFDAATGASFSWTPLAEGVLADDGSVRVEIQAYTTGDLCVTVATGRDLARHGYLARTILPTPLASSTAAAGAGAGALAEVTIAVETATIRFELPAGAERAGPLRLTRTEDASWIPMYQGPTGITVDRDATVEIVLGAGQYELTDPLAPERHQRFEVPGPGVVTLSETLTASRADRP